MNDQPLPTWLSPPERDNRDNERPMSLTPLEPSKALVSLPEFPRTKEERELVIATYERIFFLSLNAVRGGSSLRFLAKHDHRRINVGRFMQWVKSDPQRKALLEDAQAVAAELLMAETIDIADGQVDEVVEGGMPTDITRDKLRIDARTKLAGFYDPKKFGDVKRVEMTTNDITTDNVASLSTAELRAHLMRSVSLDPANIVDGELAA